MRLTPRRIAVGLVLAIVALRLFHFTTAPGAIELLALFLAYTACVYPGAGLAVPSRPWLAIETVFSLAIFTTAWLGLVGSPVWIAAGYAAHGLWDAAHHPRLIRTQIVEWFPPVCAVFDFVVAAFVVWRHGPWVA
jgi:hypothetical protein